MKDKLRVAKKKNVVEIVFALSKVQMIHHYWNDSNPVCDVLPEWNSALIWKKTKEVGIPSGL